MAAKRGPVHDHLLGQRVDRHRPMSPQPSENGELSRSQASRRQMAIVELRDMPRRLADGEAGAFLERRRPIQSTLRGLFSDMSGRAPPSYAHIRVMSRLDRKPVYCPPRSNTSASAPTISSTAPSAAKGSSASGAWRQPHRRRVVAEQLRRGGRHRQDTVSEALDRDRRGRLDPDRPALDEESAGENGRDQRPVARSSSGCAPA